MFVVIDYGLLCNVLWTFYQLCANKYIIFLVGVKDETANPADACKSAASYFSNDDKFVGIVGGYSSACSVAMQGELKRLSMYFSFI